MMLSRLDFPEPDGPTMAQPFPGAHLQVDVAECHDGWGAPVLAADSGELHQLTHLAAPPA